MFGAIASLLLLALLGAMLVQQRAALIGALEGGSARTGIR